MLGFVLIFTDFSLLAINIVGSIVFALLVPFITAGRTLLYLDLRARGVEEPVSSRARGPRWAFRRRRLGTSS